MPIVPQQTALAPEIAAVNDQGAIHVCFDIETGNADAKTIKSAQKLWRPPANMLNPETMTPKEGEDKQKFAARKKDAKAKVDAKRKEAFKSIKTKSALLDGAPIHVVVVITEKTVVAYWWGKAKKNFTRVNGDKTRAIKASDERDLLIRLRTLLDTLALPHTIVIGFNLFGFDLPKLRGAYLRYRLRTPRLFSPEARQVGVEVFDVMRKFKYFSAEKSDVKFITLAEVLERMGLPKHKGAVDGSKVPGLIKKGLMREVVTYCYLDTLGTYSTFLMMTDHYKDQKEAH